jgi:hypothetical protein
MYHSTHAFVGVAGNAAFFNYFFSRFLKNCFFFLSDLQLRSRVLRLWSAVEKYLRPSRGFEYICSRSWQYTLRPVLHVYDYVYGFKYDLHANLIDMRLSARYKIERLLASFIFRVLISRSRYYKLNCAPSLSVNRTQNRTPNRMCRRHQSTLKSTCFLSFVYIF